MPFRVTLPFLAPWYVRFGVRGVGDARIFALALLAGLLRDFAAGL